MARHKYPPILFMVALIVLFCIPGVLGAIVTTGGTITNTSTDIIHTFTSNGTFGLIQGTIQNATILIVAGGGAGGSNGGGGGGAGGVYYLTDINITANQTVVIGYGGAGINGASGANGTNSSFGTYQAYRGGGGGGSANANAGVFGGSGGGSGNPATVPGGIGLPGQGKDGGIGIIASPYCTGGGGGGSQGGGNASGSGAGVLAGIGGNGTIYSINGSSIYYGGGGGGTCWYSTQGIYGVGGQGGGGSGKSPTGSPACSAGVTNTGGGGGGGYDGAGCTGGSGIVIIRYTNYTCTPEWLCIEYQACGYNNVSNCTEAEDTNECGLPYVGDYSELAQVCLYDYPPFFVDAPPNISLNKSEYRQIQQNGSDIVGFISQWVINETRSILNGSGLLTINYSDVGLFWQNITIIDNSSQAASAYFWVHVSCFPAYYCASFGACNESNITPCLSVLDSNGCGSFEGELSTYDGSCTYCYSSWNCSHYGDCLISNISVCDLMTDNNLCNRTFTGNYTDYIQNCTYSEISLNFLLFDFSTIPGVLLFGILIFIWLALLVMGIAFDNPHLGVMSSIFGMGSGILLMRVSIIPGLGIVCVSVIVLLIAGLGGRD